MQTLSTLFITDAAFIEYDCCTALSYKIIIIFYYACYTVVVAAAVVVVVVVVVFVFVVVVVVVEGKSGTKRMTNQ